MGRHDWYRRTTWTATDAAEFFARFKRSRGDFNKIQYLRIQALALQGVGKAEDALALLDQALNDYPEVSFETASILKQRAECLSDLRRDDESFAAFRAAFAKQCSFPLVEVFVALSWFEHCWNGATEDQRNEIVAALERRPVRDAALPVEAYRFAFAMARISVDRNASAEAAVWAGRALAAAHAQHSGMSKHPTFGLVLALDERTEIWLRRVAAT